MQLQRGKLEKKTGGESLRGIKSIQCVNPGIDLCLLNYNEIRLSVDSEANNSKIYFRIYYNSVILCDFHLQTYEIYY